MFVYDFPLSPRARTYLKFESTFNNIDACSEVANNSDTYCLLRSIIDYIDLVDGSGALKFDISKDLDKLSQRLKIYAKDPEVDETLVGEVLAQIDHSYRELDKFTRQRTVLRDDPLLELIKPRFMTPCGVNCFDTPMFTFWMSLPSSEKQQSVNMWLSEIEAIRTPVSVILYIWRLCSEFQTRVARKGFMQENGDTCDLIEIRYPKTVRGYPIVSGFQSSFNVRFLPFEKKAQVGDIEFEIAYIKAT